MKTKTVASSIVAAIVSCACLFMFVPTATAAEGVTVTSTKSFPSYTQVRKDLTTPDSTCKCNGWFRVGLF